MLLMAPYRCRDCGERFFAFNRNHRTTNERNHSLAEYIGLRGREHKLRQWTIVILVAMILLAAALTLMFHIADS